MKLAISALLLAFSACSVASQVTVSQVGELVNQRLSYMKTVAAEKARTHKAVEDLAQEQRVLSVTAQHATKLGLDAESVKPFIQAQMDAAKAIQYRYRADWLAEQHPPASAMPLSEVREKISLLSDEILQQTAELLRQQGTLSEGDFVAKLQQKHLSSEDKSHLWQALEQIKLQ
ncbi:chorismate mutase [Pantoea agglomerans]